MNNQKITTALLTALVLLLVVGGTLIIKNSSKHDETGSMNMANAATASALPVAILTIADQKGELGNLENTWPGEIISFGDIQIQPRRAGTIMEWKVNIGEKVRAGQVIARLSAPPAMPELTAMLAEQAKMVTEARVDAKAQIEFAEKKKQQLVVLSEAIDKSKNANINTLDVSATKISAEDVISRSKKAVDSNRKKIQSSLEQSIRKELQIFTGNEIDILSFYKSDGQFPRLYVIQSFGRYVDNYRSDYLRILTKTLSELPKESGELETVGADYFQAATKLAGATDSDSLITTEKLTDLRKMIAMDQMAFLETVTDYRMSKTELAKMENEYKLIWNEYKLTLTEKETDYAMQKKEIDEQIAMLDKDITTNGGKVKAAEASYGTVAGGINGGLNIVSPASGIISSISKNNGDFVEPGMAVASVNTGYRKDRFVRFKIPSNIRLPKPGAELLIARPGFNNESRKIKLIGVGTALDNNGSYMADAKFIEEVDWPVNVSIRVMPNDTSSSTLFANVGAIEWTNSSSTLWIIKSDNTITKRVIKTGRTLGEKVEVYEGVSVGDKYVGKIIPGLQEGVLIMEGEIVKAAPPAADAHGHNE